MTPRLRRTSPCALLFLAGTAAAHSFNDAPLEDLMAIPLTTLGRRVQPVQDIPIAASVVSGEELHRGGARSVIDALRWMPGVSVEQLNGRSRTVAARGDGSSSFARNILVLLDGREQYSPLTGGAPWDVLDLPLERVERIEVQRGAGNALWGGHAANCVINIVTRTPGQGSGVSVDADTDGRTRAAGSWSSKPAPDGGSSAWAQGSHAPGTQNFRGRDDWDNARSESAGGATRQTLPGGGELVLDLRAYNGAGGNDLRDRSLGARRSDYRVAQREAGARLTQPTADDGQWELSGYLQRNTTSLDVQQAARRDVAHVAGQRLWRGREHDVIAGASTQVAWQELLGVSAQPLPLVPQQRVVRAYAQDEWRPGEGSLAIVVGGQAEHYHGDGDETVHSEAVRLRWSASPQLTWWSAVSQSGAAPGELTTGGRDLRIPAAEMGMRWLVSPRLQLNAAAFEQHVNGVKLQAMPGGQASTSADDGARLRVRGFESDWHWQPADAWQLDGSMTLLRAKVQRATQGSVPLSEGTYFGATPRNDLKLRVAYAADERHSFEAALTARSALKAGDGSPGRGVLDLIHRQRLRHGVEFGVALRQANHDRLDDLRTPQQGIQYQQARTLALWVSWDTD